jgi:hypothetical protein
MLSRGQKKLAPRAAELNPTCRPSSERSSDAAPDRRAPAALGSRPR